MKEKFIYILIAIISLFPFSSSKAQIKVTEEGPGSLKKGVIVYADPRLDMLVKKYRNVKLGVIRSGKGYRVQIYAGNDRQKATSVKIDFMRRYPGINTYMTYTQPQFRVKVGDYRTRAEAAEMYGELNKLYTPCMIVPDIIVINTLRNDQ